jgi:CRP-like cAMP-binding protein
MPADVSCVGYFIWGVDHAVYGPVELPVLVGWINDERIIADTWIYLEHGGCWEQAGRIPELRMFFNGRHAGTPAPAGSARPGGQPTAGALRHIKVLACLTDPQLERFLQLVELQNIPAGTVLARQGDPADAMYLLVEGELRVRIQADGREHSLDNLESGEFFGEISLLDHGLRMANITAIRDSIVIKITAAEFERITNDNPDLATPFLYALARTLACRIRSENKRYRDSMSFIHPAHTPTTTAPTRAVWSGSTEPR